MSKRRIRKIADSLNLKYDTKGKVMFGLYKGYEIVIQEHTRDSVYYIGFPMRASDPEHYGDIDVLTKELLENKKVINKAIYEDYCLRIHLNFSFTANKDIQNIIDTLDKIEDFARNNYYNSCCELCGESANTSINLINTAPLRYCEKCSSETMATLEEAQTNFKNQKSQIISGIVGAFLGSLIGVALWVVVYAVGYIAAVCGVVLAVCTLKGYQKLGGKLDKLGITIAVVITMAMVFVANYISYGYEVYIAFKEIEDINIFQGIQAVGFFLSEYDDFRNSFIGDLIQGYFFTIIATATTFINAYKDSSCKYEIRKLDN